MLDEIKIELAENFRDGDEEILQNIILRMKDVASKKANRSIEDINIEPYIIDAVKKAYLKRGEEGMNNTSKNGTSISYTQIENELRDNLISSHLRVII